MIRFGVNTFLWVSPFTTKDLAIVQRSRALGFDVVEVAIEHEGDVDFPVLADACRREGIACSLCAVMGPGRDPSHEDETIQRNAVSYLRHCIDGAATVNALKLAGPIYAAVGRQWQATPDRRRRDLDRCVRNLRPVARYAAERGVTLAIEPINRFETSFINLTSQALELMEMIDSPAVKVMMDTFHANIEEKSIAGAVRAAGRNLVHLHANENDRGTPGSGHLPWEELANALKEVEYDGVMVIESFSTEVKEIARAAAVWRPLASSPGALARDGLAFLRRLMA